MPRGGHNRKTTRQHVLDGTYRKDRHAGRLDAQVAPAELQRPPGLDAVEGDCWQRMVDSTPPGILTELDRHALEIYCRLWAMSCRVWSQFVADPLDKATRISAFGLLDRLDKIGRQFGWSPASRAALRWPVETEHEDDPLVAYLMRHHDQDDE